MALKLPLARNHSDEFQTPAWVVEPLFEYIPKTALVWEPACGKGNIVRAFLSRRRCCYGTDLHADTPMAESDFLCASRTPADYIVTNPPYTLKDQFIAKCYELGNPWAMLMPLTALEGMKRMAMYREHGIQLIIPPRRVNFETPNGKAEGSGSSAHFMSAWFMWGFNLPRDIVFWEGATK